MVGIRTLPERTSAGEGNAWQQQPLNSSREVPCATRCFFELSSSDQPAQVELSVKHAFGIPVARDSRMGDIRQRGMRACLFYDNGTEVDK